MSAVGQGLVCGQEGSGLIFQSLLDFRAVPFRRLGIRRVHEPIGGHPAGAVARRRLCRNGRLV
jgi:hypothetical protein